jgi:hypothetical protein
MAKGKNAPEPEVFTCPVGKFFMGLEKATKGGSSFFEHMNLSRLEFLKAVRALVNERIEKIEKDSGSCEEKKATRIKVE